MFGKGKRFDEVSSESFAWGILKVVEDRETGVQYLCTCSPSTGPTCVTPLLDRNGNVIVSLDD